MDIQTKKRPLSGAAAMGAGPGRPKGSSNRMTREVKDAISLAAEKLGGVDRLVSWAQEDEKNERIFWGTVYPKLIPVTLAGDANNPIRASLVVEFVKP